MHEPASIDRSSAATRAGSRLPEGEVPSRIGIVGPGRLGSALAEALRAAGVEVDGPVGRGEVPAGDAVVLCVPDGQIGAAARTVAGTAPLVGHTSGATPLSALEAASDAGAALFGLHPLQSFPGGDPELGAKRFRGAGCAVAGSSPEALGAAAAIARAVGMRPFEIDDAGRPAYHAAASIASNFVVTLAASAESLAAQAGLDPAEARSLLAPLVRSTVESWAAFGPADALTGPVARGDDATVAAQREAAADAHPELLPLFDSLVERTRALAGRPVPSGGAMRTVRTVPELRAALAPERRAGRSVGLVATMGALHEGHLSLVRRAREQCDVVAMSLFVNPAQFDAGDDLVRYPRDHQRDAALAAEAGVHVLFAPDVEEVYPAGFETWVEVGGITDVLEGDASSRGPGHFRGVTTIVTKLFNAVSPDVAYFGQKDAQQALVIRRLVRDLDMPVRIEVCPTVRDADGLALSSRNAYLEPHERRRALGLSRALAAAETAVAEGEREGKRVLEAAREQLELAGLEPEYLELRSAHDLSPIERVNGSALLAIAARVGGVRLIDNTIFGGAPSDERC